MMGMMSCKQASELVSQGLDRKLGIGERFLLGLHLRICRNCERFNRQMGMLRRALQRLPEEETASGTGGQKG
jgi:hypothetical protein